jgi:hypothetical protein
MGSDARREITALLAAGDADGALDRCRAYFDEVGGPEAEPGEGNDYLREFNRRLTVWQQIELYVREVDRRPQNKRSWKLLGYAYMWAGLYVPVLLRAAGQAFLASAAREENAAPAANLEEKIELCRLALAGDEEARAELATGGRTFAAEFAEFPAVVPMPEPFVCAGIVGERELKVTAAVIAPDLLDVLNG